jgi:hypothetical protein
MTDSGETTTVDARTDPDESAEEPDEVDTSHLDDVEDGCGCAEVWEHTSDERTNK